MQSCTARTGQTTSAPLLSARLAAAMLSANLWFTLVVVTFSLSNGIVTGQEVGKFLAAGDAAMLNSQYTSAISQYTAALAVDAASALIYNKRAAAYSAQGNTYSALRDFEQAISLEPSLLGARLNRAKLQTRFCRFEEAESDVRHILESRPTHKGASAELEKLELGRRLLQAARNQSGGEKRRGTLSELLDLSPQCSPAKLMEAELLFGQEDYGGVVLMTGQVLKNDAASIVALVLRGRAYIQLGDLEVAKRHFSEALRSDPDHKEAKILFKAVKNLQRHKEQAESAASAGNAEQAEAEYMQALNLDSASKIITSALWLELCKVRLRLQKAGPAVEACSTAYEQLPDDEDALVQKVKALIAAGEHGAAFREASAGRQKFGNSQQVYQVMREAEKAQKLAERKQYYEILGVSRNSGDAEIKKAYRDLARRFHPDKAATEGITTEAAHEKFTEISESYEVLSDPEKRAAYDRGDDVQLGSGQAGFQGGGFPGGFGGFPGGGQHFTFQFG